jgi:hypothetical protein
MQGTVVNTKGNWVVEYETGAVPLRISLPLHVDDIAQVESGQQVQFIIVDEFTHPELFYNVGWGDGTTCAKIINQLVG